jgi:hypothetical protein
MSIESLGHVVKQHVHTIVSDQGSNMVAGLADVSMGGLQHCDQGTSCSAAWLLAWLYFQ